MARWFCATYTYSPGNHDIEQGRVRDAETVFAELDAMDKDCSVYKPILLADEPLMESDDILVEYLSSDESVRWGNLDSSIRQAYVRYRGFSNQILREKMGWRALTPLDAFYNAYFWMVAFSKRYQKHHGADAGIEQQVFKLIEAAPPGVDWKIIENIAHSAA